MAAVVVAAPLDNLVIRNIDLAAGSENIIKEETVVVRRSHHNNSVAVQQIRGCQRRLSKRSHKQRRNHRREHVVNTSNLLAHPDRGNRRQRQLFLRLIRRLW